MSTIEEAIRSRLDRLEEEFDAHLPDLPLRVRTRVRTRQAYTAAMAVTAIAVFALLLVGALSEFATPATSPTHPAAPAAPLKHKITPLKRTATTGVIASFDLDGNLNSLQLGSYAGKEDMELVGPEGDRSLYELPAGNELAIKMTFKSFGGAMLVAGFAPSAAASVTVTTSDGRAFDASLYVLPESLTTDFEAFGIVVPAPMADYEVTAYTADGAVIATASNPLPSSPTGP